MRREPLASLGDGAVEEQPPFFEVEHPVGDVENAFDPLFGEDDRAAGCGDPGEERVRAGPVEL